MSDGRCTQDFEKCLSVSTPFWEALAAKGNAVALVDSRQGQCLTYRNLGFQVEAAAHLLRAREKAMVFHFAENDVGAIIWYLAALQANHAVHLANASLNHPSSRLAVSKYSPDFILLKAHQAAGHIRDSFRELGTVSDYTLFEKVMRNNSPISQDLALVLSTSASSGSAKFVRLSRRNLMASALQVATSLRVTDGDRGLVSVPFTHVYGLSIVNSHLLVGGGVVLIQNSPADPAYWDVLEKARISNIAGVSMTFEFLRTSKGLRKVAQQLRMVTHSGDVLSAETFSWIYDTFASQGVEICLMYGQTEAAGRISVLPSTFLPFNSRSVGRAVPGGHVNISADGEVIFAGPNVMLGYGSSRADLGLGDELRGVLKTGDLGYLDTKDLLFLIGRANRFCKVFGQRIHLDEIEEFFVDLGPTAAVSKNGAIAISGEAEETLLRVRALEFVKAYRLPPQCISVRSLAALPRTPTGKIAYQHL